LAAARFERLGLLLIAKLGLLLNELPEAINIERLGNYQVEILTVLSVGEKAWEVGGNSDQFRQIASM